MNLVTKNDQTTRHFDQDLPPIKAAIGPTANQLACSGRPAPLWCTTELQVHCSALWDPSNETSKSTTYTHLKPPMSSPLNSPPNVMHLYPLLESLREAISTHISKQRRDFLYVIAARTERFSSRPKHKKNI